MLKNKQPGEIYNGQNMKQQLKMLDGTWTEYAEQNTT